MMIWIVLALFSVVHGTPVRICVPESLSGPCAQMLNYETVTLTCLTAPDVFGCLRKVQQGEADVTNADPNAIYLGGKYFNLRPILTELVEGEPFRYQGIALVSKNSSAQSASDLRDRSSCHTGLGRTVGWQIPIGMLLAKNVMPFDCREGELASVQNFFNGSCVPGLWSKDPVVNRRLKNQYKSLCSRCKNPSACDSNDEYAGYEGVMKCLSEKAGEVAFTKIPALREYLLKNPDFEQKAEILCFDGGRKSVRDPQPCVWDSRPTNAFLAKSGSDDIERLITVLLDAEFEYSLFNLIPDWYHNILKSNRNVNGLRRTEEDRKTYLSYLGDFIHAIRKPSPGCRGEKEGDAFFCVTSDEEVSKCQDFSKAAEAKGMWPDIKCVKAASKVACMENLKKDNAQLLVLDGGDVYKGGRYFGLLPVAGELYNGSDATYYAVAVLRSASDVTKLSQLSGLRSCHTGMGRTAGWVMPVGVLLSDGLLSTADSCNRAAAVADFFNAGSCVPGANDTKYNPGRVRSEDLCRHCVGDEEGNHKCSRDSKERYSGYAGALRCLAEGRGDIAFVKHTTVPDYTDGHGQPAWAKDLLSSDFMLLCDRDGTSSPFDYLQCNLGKVPSHHVMTGGGISELRRLQLSRLMADSSSNFANDSSLYRLFSPRKNPDLLFKDSATGLKITPLEDSYEQVLGQRFLEASKAADPKACL